MYTYPSTPELIEKLKPFWKKMRKAEDQFICDLNAIESEISKATGIEDIVFFWSDNEIVGIGNAGRNMELIHDGELEEV
jgi:hypothetical protein